ncbi:amino acid adenylation domain-containing protein [Nakamurella sp. UYEF19]|uniref:AMP-binding protein n=1 Tax=Nakamurella sp. UYEF19 TaxID=1756392 RepID=UPI003399DF09
MSTFHAPLYGRFLRGLAVSEHRPAWRVRGHETTYREAHESALTLAGTALAAIDDAAGAIGIFATKNSAAYLGILAALYAGRTAVPLHLAQPDERNADAVRDAGVRAILTDAPGAVKLVETGIAGGTTGIPLILVEAADLTEAGTADSLAGVVKADPARALTGPRPVLGSDIAYIMFTSGSTGRPKGVQITNANIAHYCDIHDSRYDFRPQDVFSQYFDLAFDCAMFDLFIGWGAGACVAPISGPDLRDLPGAIARKGISIWYSTPSAIGVADRMGRLTPGSLPSIRYSFFAGDALRVADAITWSQACDHGILDNGYGPTENTITMSRHRWDPKTSMAKSVNGIVPLGRIYDGMQMLVLDGDKESTEGELCLFGPQNSPGYLDPADDEGRFFDRYGRRWYRTGDVVRLLDDGDMVFLGRADDQVQVAGQRVQLSEIDHALQAHPAVEFSATVPVSDGGCLELAAYFTGDDVPVGELVRHLRGLLPDGLVPRRFTRLDEMPLNQNRKTDRKALRAMAVHAQIQPAPADAPLFAILAEAAAHHPDRPAVRDSDGDWTYAQLLEQSLRVSGYLQAQGIRRGDRVLVQLPNVREFVALLFGCARGGVAVVPLNPDMKTYHLRAVLSDCSPSLAVATTGRAPDLAEIGGVPVLTTAQLWAELGPVEQSVPAAGHGEDVGTLIYTSGSTAAPKGVICPQAQMAFAARAIGSQLGYRNDDVVYTRVPLSFDYGMFQIMLSALAGSELVLAAGPDLTLLNEIREYGATVVPAVPSLSVMLNRLAARDDRPTSLRLVTNTGAALQQSTIDELRARFPGLRVARMYGITECKRVSIMPPEQEFERPASVGRPLPGTTVVILGDDGSEVPTGQVGQIVVDGPNVMGGYWNAPELSEKTFRPDPVTGRTRLFTGDYGSVDSGGYLYFQGRRDDMFKRRGLRMSTIEIEAAATDIPGIRAAAALAPTDTYDLALWVAGDLDAATVKRELADRLEPAKVPAFVRVLDELPVTLNGKPDKKQVAQMMADLSAVRA